jgi:hypothetical protein
VVGSYGSGPLCLPEASGGYDDHTLGTFDDFVAEDVVGIYREVAGDVVEICQCSSGYGGC